MELLGLTLSIKESSVQKTKVGDKSTIDVRIDNPDLSKKLREKYWNKYYVGLKKLMPDILHELGLKEQKVNWNRYAGCRCGCSPAFLLEKDKGKYYIVTIQ